MPQLTQYCAYFWDVLTLVSGIPVAAIMVCRRAHRAKCNSTQVRYNLLSGKVCGPFWSFFWGVVSPWIFTAFFYETNLLVRIYLYQTVGSMTQTTICNWATILVAGYVNFCIPCMLYRTAYMRKYSQNSPTVRHVLACNGVI